MSKPRDSKLFIIDGLKIGRVTVGDLVRDVRNHPLYIQTPQSYLHQGRLREVYCDCGEVRLISESILATGRIQSCGCLRKELIDQARLEKLAKSEKQHLKKQLIAQIKYEQHKLKVLQAVRVPLRDEKAIDEAAKTLRSLFARKSALSRKESYKDTYEKTTKKIMMDKLFEDPES